MVSDATAAFLPASVLGDARDGGRLLVRMPPVPLAKVDTLVPTVMEPRAVPRYRRSDASQRPDIDPEHRRVAISFVRFDGFDAIIDREGRRGGARSASAG